MAEPTYKPNSYKRKEEAEKREPVVSNGSASVHRKTALERAAIDTINSAKPQLKDLIVSVIKRFIDGVAYGGSGTIISSKPAPTTSRIAYNRPGSIRRTRPVNSVYDYGEVKIRTVDPITGKFDRRMAQEDRRRVVSSLLGCIDRYSHANVADLYEFSNLVDEIQPSDYNYGWYDISGWQILDVYGPDPGVVIKLPRTVALAR